jgi:hypothetical protein
MIDFASFWGLAGEVWIAILGTESDLVTTWKDAIDFSAHLDGQEV